MLELPNTPARVAPPTACARRTRRCTRCRAARKPEFDFEPRDHLELAGALIDMERGARTSGSRFAYLLGDLVRLHVAIVQYALDKLVGKGFTPVMPPVLVREEALVGTGFFPEAREQVYALAERDDLFLVGTSEVSLAALHMGEILAEDELPLRYCGLSSCFRREAGAAGKDTRGIFRTHQFEKVEMFSFCHPDRSWDEHELTCSRSSARSPTTLGLHYRVVNIAVGDLGAPAAKKYDIEAWLPGQGRYRELTRCSNMHRLPGAPARRALPRARRACATCTRSTAPAVTSSRTLIAVLETHQQSRRQRRACPRCCRASARPPRSARRADALS